MIARLSFFCGLLLLASIVGCGDDVPTIRRPVHDAGIECSAPVAVGMDASTPMAAPSCPEGRACVQGRCVDRCTADSDCARTEECDTGRGLCVPGGAPRPDAGPPPDTGFDPCAEAMCMDGTVCHPSTGGCVQCATDECGGAAPICDRGRGECVVYDPRPCAPCRNDLDCVDTGGTRHGTCVDTDRAHERTCVPSCAADGGTCPTGLVCAGGECLPHAISCTAFLAAVDAMACFVDQDCVPLGNTAATGQCDGVMGGADGGVPGRCLQPCGLPSHCPAGTTCGADMFCRPMM